MSFWDKRPKVLKLIEIEGECGHCGRVHMISAWTDHVNKHLFVACRACGAKATVRVKAKHTAGRVAAAACYALKRQYTAAVAEELMK
jgi:transcription elongation factor Elf1